MTPTSIMGHEIPRLYGPLLMLARFVPVPEPLTYPQCKNQKYFSTAKSNPKRCG